MGDMTGIPLRVWALIPKNQTPLSTRKDAPHSIRRGHPFQNIFVRPRVRPLRAQSKGRVDPKSFLHFILLTKRHVRTFFDHATVNFCNAGRRCARSYVIQRRGTNRRPPAFPENQQPQNVWDREAALLRIHVFASSLTLVVLTSSFAWGADSPAISVLKQKGLTRSGRFFVIEAEKPVLKKLRESWTVLTENSAIAKRKSEAEMAATELAQLEERRAELQQRLEETNQQINEQGFQQGNNQARPGPNNFGQGGFASPLSAQRNLIQMSLAEINTALKTAKAETPKDSDRKALEEESRKNLEACKEALAALRKSVDDVMKQYDDLRANTSVKSALLALEKDRLGTFTLGPSTTFKNAVKTIEKAERMILAKKTSTVSRKKGRSRQ